MTIRGMACTLAAACLFLFPSLHAQEMQEAAKKACKNLLAKPEAARDKDAVGLCVGLTSSYMLKLFDIETFGAGASGTTQSPLMVRGGALTFRSSRAPWKSFSNGFCISVNAADAGTLTLVDVATHDPKVGEDIYATKPQPITLNANSVINLYGRNTNNKEGIQIAFTNQCDGNKYGISVLPLPGNASTKFYPGSKLDEDNGVTHSQRFKDTACTEAGDQDFCEHLGKIVISNPNHSYYCLNGECTLTVGP